MRYFDYGFLRGKDVSAYAVRMIADVSRTQGQNTYRKDKLGKLFSALENVAKIESVKSSNAIEGIATSDARLAEIVRENAEPTGHAEEELAGYRDALSLVHSAHETQPFSEDTILRLHAILYAHTSEKGGQYKKDDNIISQRSDRGEVIVRFRPVSAAETLGTMLQFTLAAREALSDASINKLILIPCIIQDFLCIHPFNDGNGRMSRLLSLLLLYKSGYDAGKYVSMDRVISENRGQYYEALYKSSQDWHFNRNDYDPFVEFFLESLAACYRELSDRLDIAEHTGGRIADRIAEYLRGRTEAMSKTQIQSVFPDKRIGTVESALAELVKCGIIKKEGSYRDAKYIYFGKRS